MRFDTDQATAFLARWDAHRANRAEIARDLGMNRSHAYEIADKCRAALAQIGAGQKQNGPQPSS